VSEKFHFKHIKIEQPEECGGKIKGNYSIISLNRPNKLNAITVQSLEEIVTALYSMELNPFKPGIKPNIPIHMTYAMHLFHKQFNLMEQFPKPLAAACSIDVFQKDSFFRMNHSAIKLTGIFFNPNYS
jgi:enoyl-CoA hydratase/carnithine racemase